MNDKETKNIIEQSSNINLEKFIKSDETTFIAFTNLENKTSLKFYSDEKTIISVIQKEGTLVISMIVYKNDLSHNKINGSLGDKINSLDISEIDKIKKVLEFTANTIQEHHISQQHSNSQNVLNSLSNSN